MKEIRKIIAAYHNWQGKKMLLATVFKVEGSSYRKEGARMLIREDGIWEGGISGGCLEGDALKKARLAIAQGQVKTVVYDTTSDDPLTIGVSLGCKGILHVLLVPLEDAEIINTLKIAAFNREKSSICWDLETGKPKANNSEGFLETFKPNLRLHIVGTNYDIYPLIEMADVMGWDVSISCNPLKFRSEYQPKVTAVLEKTELPVFDNYTALVMMTHDYFLDLDLLKELINAPKPLPGYFGMLGPRKRMQQMHQDLLPLVIPENLINILKSPVGLDIGGYTPEAIALSICAEINSVFEEKTLTQKK